MSEVIKTFEKNDIFKSEGFRDLQRTVQRFTEASPDVRNYTPMFLICDDVAAVQAAIDHLKQKDSGSQIEVIDATTIPTDHPDHLLYSLVRYFPKGQAAINKALDNTPENFIVTQKLDRYRQSSGRDKPPAVIVVLNTDVLSVEPDGSPADPRSLSLISRLGFVRDNLAGSEGLLPAAVIFHVSPKGQKVFYDNMRDTAEWMQHINL